MGVREREGLRTSAPAQYTQDEYFDRTVTRATNWDLGVTQLANVHG